MLGTLKGLLIAYGIILAALGIAFIIFPEQTASSLFSLENIGSGAQFFEFLLGAACLAAGFYIASAGRDPITHITWVKFTVLTMALLAAVFAYSLIESYIEPTGLNIALLVVNVAWGAALLITYPWGSKQGGYRS